MTSKEEVKNDTKLEQNGHLECEYVESHDNVLQAQLLMMEFARVLDENLKKIVFSETVSTMHRMENQAFIERINNMICNSSFVEIPTFSGDLKHFGAFSELFEKAVKRAKLSDVEKFIFLSKKVSGEALSLIGYLHITEENYAIAWNMLKEKYDDVRTLIAMELDALIDLPKTIANDTESIKALIYIFPAIIWNLKAYGIILDKCVIAAYLVIRKFDRDTRLEFERFFSTRNEKVPDVTHVLEFLETHCRLLERISSITNRQDVNDGRKGNKQSQKELAKNERGCLICTKTHRTAACPQIKEASDKMTFLKDKRICIFCANHKFSYTNPCRTMSKLRCDVCQGKHLTILHTVNK